MHVIVLTDAEVRTRRKVLKKGGGGGGDHKISSAYHPQTNRLVEGITKLYNDHCLNLSVTNKIHYWMG